MFNLSILWKYKDHNATNNQTWSRITHSFPPCLPHSDNDKWSPHHSPFTIRTNKTTTFCISPLNVPRANQETKIIKLFHFWSIKNSWPAEKILILCLICEEKVSILEIKKTKKDAWFLLHNPLWFGSCDWRGYWVLEEREYGIIRRGCWHWIGSYLCWVLES